MKLINKYVTAARRIFQPNLKFGDLVIDLGCGGNPAPRAHVACDFMSEDDERDLPLKIDRPFVWASLENLPFKNKAFDYSICSHVVEHLEKPETCLLEIERISKSGYIETPNSFYEYVIPHTYHVSRVTVIDNKLNITFKETWNDTFSNNHNDVLHDAKKIWWRIHETSTKDLLTKFYWKDKLDFKITNTLPMTFKKEIEKGVNVEAIRSPIKKILIKIAYLILRPLNKVRLIDVLYCPSCKSESLKIDDSKVLCESCNCEYPKYRGYYDFRI